MHVDPGKQKKYVTFSIHAIIYNTLNNRCMCIQETQNALNIGYFLYTLMNYNTPNNTCMLIQEMVNLQFTAHWIQEMENVCYTYHILAMYYDTPN